MNIPKIGQLVRWNNKLFTVVSVNLGGKCVIKQFTTTRRLGKVVSNIDILELSFVE